MEHSKLEHLLQEAQKGDEQSREKILHHFKSFVLNAASRVCNRYLTWSDDETSIGLFAMNKAIDRFNHKLGKSFLNFSYMLISQEIIDFFRKEKRHQNVSLNEPTANSDDDSHEGSWYEREVATRQYELKLDQEELIHEIMIYQADLESYGLSFESLPEQSPKHKDTRDNCFALARAMVADSALVASMKAKKRLPITELSKATGVSVKTIEKNRKYILAVTLLLLNPELERLHTYIEKGGEE